MQIPFSPPYIDEDIIQEVNDVLRSGWITTGPKVMQLEEAVAVYCNVEKALAVNSATSAIMLVLNWFGIKHGDEVIVPAYTYCATALAVMHAGATPVMVDVREDFNIDPQKIREAITEKTKAIIAVDIGGWPSDYDTISSIVNDDCIRKKFIPTTKIQRDLGRLLIIDDAAHSLGAIYNNIRVGKHTDITIFSLHAVKNITTAEGGIICLNMPAPFNNDTIYNILRLWRLNGQSKDAYSKLQANGWRYDIVYPGFKINMPDVLAAIGLVQLRKYKNYLLPERQRIFKYYTQFFKKYEWAICPPHNSDGCASSCHLYLLRIKELTEEKRDEIIQYITKKNVAVNVHFIPLPMFSVFKNLGYVIEAYPQSYLQYMNEISLPIYPQLGENECAYVAQIVAEAVKIVTGNER